MNGALVLRYAAALADVPIEQKSKSGPVMFMTDEQPRSDATLENLARLKPAFDPEGTVTAGNASSINDGAAAVVLMERSAAQERGLKPISLAEKAAAAVVSRNGSSAPAPGLVTSS